MCYHVFFCENKPLIWRLGSERPQDLDARFFEAAKAAFDSGNCFHSRKKKIPQSSAFPRAADWNGRFAPPIRTSAGKLLPLPARALYRCFEYQCDSTFHAVQAVAACRSGDALQVGPHEFLRQHRLEG